MYADNPNLNEAIAQTLTSTGGQIASFQNISPYFNWPGAWLLFGILKSVAGLDLFFVYSALVISLSFALALLMFNFCKGIWKNQMFAFASLLVFALVSNPRVVQFTPGLLGFVFLMLILIGLQKLSNPLILIGFVGAVVSILSQHFAV